MRPRRVAIGIDFSEAAVAAARWTARHFSPDAEIVLVHAIDVPEPPRFLRGRFPPAGPLVEVAREGAEQKLRALGASLGAARVSFEIRTGHPAAELARVSRALGADLVVVGKHGERPRLLGRLGSTAERLAWDSALPVLLATGMRDATPARILVALDDDAAAPWVLRWTRELSERFDATVTAINVVSSAVLGHVLSMAAVGPNGVSLDRQQVQAEFREDTDRWLEQLVRTGLPRERVSCETAFGDPAQEIVAAGDRLGSDLIVVGSRRPGALRRTLLGSVAGEVMRHATRPVLVVKEPENEVARTGDLDEAIRY